MLVFVCLYVCVCTCVRACVRMCTHVQAHAYRVSSKSLGITFRNTVLLKTGLLIALELTRLEWLASETLGSSCFSFPSAGITSMLQS